MIKIKKILKKLSKTDNYHNYLKGGTKKSPESEDNSREKEKNLYINEMWIKAKISINRQTKGKLKKKRKSSSLWKNFSKFIKYYFKYFTFFGYIS